MKNIFVAIALSACACSQAQSIDKLINAAEVERVEKVLSSDSLRGRKVFTPDIEKAADFIIAEFKKAGLQPLPGASDYRQTFYMLKVESSTQQAVVDNVTLPADNVAVVSAKEDVKVTNESGFDKVVVGPKDNFFNAAISALQGTKNTIVFVDSSFKNNLARIARFAKQIPSTAPTIVFLIGNGMVQQYDITAKLSFTKLPLSNIAGVLPGKSKPNEYVIFSGHYDHLGVGKPINGDSIYNGANDDAAGTTAVITLAKYFSTIKNNERSIIFATFTAEEIGEYGSAYFSHQFNPEQVKAMFNIEMIGTESKWGKNSAYITGFDKTDMGKILQQNLKGSNFTFYPDPYTEQQLFYRSDNATLARVGVPAHTISTSKMDSEPNYHKVTDEIGTLDMNNMAEIIKAIAISSQSIVSGKDTPSRVVPEKE